MTIPKSTEQNYYPIKRKRQARRLSPNYPAISRLEAETRWETEPFETYQVVDGPDSYTGTRYNGWFDARRGGMYPRRMFDVFPCDVSSSNFVRTAKPCPDCDDWSRTARCAVHHDNDGIAGLQKGHERSRDAALERVRERGLGQTRGGIGLAEYLRDAPDRRLATVTQEAHLLDSQFQQIRNIRMEIRNIRMEILGETVQGAGPVSIEVEGDQNG